MKGTLPLPGGRNTSLPLKRRNSGSRRLYKQNVTFSLIYQPKLKFVLSIFHKCIVSLPKRERNECCLLWLPLWASLIAQLAKNLACNADDPSLFPGSGRSPGEGIGYPLQYSGLEKSMGCIVHWVANSQTRLSNFHFLL